MSSFKKCDNSVRKLAAEILFLSGILFPVDNPNDTKMTISSGDKSVDTTVGQMKQLSKKLKEA